MNEPDEEQAQEESMVHRLGGTEPETDPEPDPEPPPFVDVCMYLADQMHVIVSVTTGGELSTHEEVELRPYVYSAADRIAAAQVWLNAAGALHNAQMQERMQMEVLRQNDLLAKAQGGGGLLVPIGMAPPPGIKH
jgi:hypothetical protein